MDRHEKRLVKIRPAFTAGLRTLTDGLRLHDALFLFLGRSESRCHLALQTDQDPATIVSLEYSLLAEPLIKRDVLPAKLRINGSFFLYDEIDLASRNGHNAFTHSILFADGMYLRLRFSDVSVRLVEPLIHAPAAVSNRVTSRSA
jgi:hypothetical protein